MTTNIYSNLWLDQVFEKQNKNYGAYYLRTHANEYTLKGLFIALVFIISIAIVPAIVNGISGKSELEHLNGEHFFTVMDMPPALPAVPAVIEVLKTQVVPAAPKLISDLVKPIIVPKESSSSNEKDNELVNTNPNALNASLNGTGLAKDTATGTGENNLTGTASVDTNKYRGGVEVMPEFPGGESALIHYLQSNLKYPSRLIEQNIQGTVYLSFIINQSGSVTEIEVLRGVRGSKDFENEAKRVVAQMPHWKPGRQNGQNVNVYFMLPISFSLK